MTKLHSFAELGNAFASEKAAMTKEIFDRVLKDKFETVSPGNFKSELSEIESISLLPHLSSKENPHIKVIIFYKNSKARKKHITWSILKEGIISGEMEDLPVSRVDMSFEIMRLIEEIGPDFWKKADLSILPIASSTRPKSTRG